MLPAQPCVLCGGMSHEGMWCAPCDEASPYLNEPHCPVCSLPSPTREICGKCLKHPPLFTRTACVFTYTFPLDKLILAMKYGGQLTLAEAFAKKMAKRIDRHTLPDYVIPMPLHPTRLRERGFNQSLLLASTIARQLGIVLLPDSCQRIRNTPSQSSLPWKERNKNVRNAFRCDIDLSGKHVALVDDVLTTGASLNALAAAARQKGAEEISTWVIARTLPHKDKAF